MSDSAAVRLWGLALMVVGGLICGSGYLLQQASQSPWDTVAYVVGGIIAFIGLILLAGGEFAVDILEGIADLLKLL